MAVVIKEKSMGGAAWYEEKRSPLSHPPAASAVSKSKKNFISVHTLLLTLAMIGSATLFIFCRTTAPVYEGHNEIEIPSAVTEKAPEPIMTIPDLTPLHRIMNLAYAESELQGIFWQEKQFDQQYYLSFDDGPNLQPIASEGKKKSITSSILDSLSIHNAKAVFFINGNKLEYENSIEKEEIRSLLLRIIEDGHLLGNHSYNHHNLAQGKFSDGSGDKLEIAEEFILTQNALNEILGFHYPMVLVRPPYAEPGRTKDLDDWLIDEQYYLISLQFDSFDYAYTDNGQWNKETIPQRIKNLMQEQESGGVLLLHELESTALFLPELLNDLSVNKGMDFPGMEEHLEKKYGRRS